MASLTESSLSYPDNNENNTWYNRVYLCIEKKNDNQCINGFNCYSFQNLNQADAFHKRQTTNEKRHNIIPVCKWIPVLFHKYYINYSLKKLYWKNDITILKNGKYI